MKRELHVLFSEERGAEKKGRSAAYLVPLLGETPLEIMAESVFCLRPERKMLGLEPSGLEERLKKVGWEVLSQTRKKPFITNGFTYFREAFSGIKEGDFLLLHPFFPLLQAKSLKRLVAEHRQKGYALSLLVYEKSINPSGKRGNNQGRQPTGDRKEKKSFGILALLIQKEAFIDPGQKALRSLWNLYQGSEDILYFRERSGLKINLIFLAAEEALDIRYPEERLRAVALLREQKNNELLARGVILLDPGSVWIDLKVRIGRGSVISPAVVIEGDSRLGKNVRVYPFSHIINTVIGHGATILSATMIEGSRLAEGARVGPFAHLRPGTFIKKGSYVGNFVEMKKTVFGRGSKAGHLSYLGDSKVGDGVNIGAGTITCNYDGKQKHQTIIEAGAFIGSGTELVAPVKIGRGAYVAAGSTITKNVSAGALALARARQVEIPEWAKRRRGK